MVLLVAFMLAGLAGAAWGQAASQMIGGATAVSGRLAITTNTDNRGTRITAVVVGEEPDSFLIVPNSFYEALKGFADRRVIVRGETVNLPGLQSTIRIPGAAAVTLKPTVTLSGLVVKARVGRADRILIRRGNAVYEPLQPVDEQKLAPFLDSEVTAECYIQGVRPDGRRIEELVRVVPLDRTATGFGLPTKNYPAPPAAGQQFGAQLPADAPDPAARPCGETAAFKPGTVVMSAADGLVRYADNIPSSTPEAGEPYRGFGRIVIIEHRIKIGTDIDSWVCTVYACLGSLRIKEGVTVTRGQAIGTVGDDRDGANGGYPPHLFFGIHRGPYFQLAPSQERILRQLAATTGLPGPDGVLFKGTDLQIVHTGRDMAEIRLPSAVTAPQAITIALTETPPAPPGLPPAAALMGWVRMWVPGTDLAEWEDTTPFIKLHAPPAKD
ncbi:MAG: M23 family metallopeptidase [Planctomycetota bacterium]